MLRLALFAFLTALGGTASAGITLLDTPADTSGGTTADTTGEAGADRSDEDWLAVFLDRVKGLDGPLFPPPAALPCDDTGAETLVLLVAAGDSMQDPRYWLPGPVNDVALIASTLVQRGVAPGNIVTLTGTEATNAGLTRAARAFLDRASCGDSVVLHFSAFALDAYNVGLSEWDVPFTDEDPAITLDELGGTAFKRGVADGVLAGGPFIALNLSEPGKGDVLSAAALSELVTLLRNRGADVNVVLDVASARSLRLEQRQSTIDPRAWTFVTLADPERSGGFAPTALGHGRIGGLTVFYGSEEGDPGTEKGYPQRGENRLQYGTFSYLFARALSVSDRTTVGALMRAIAALPDTAAGVRAGGDGPQQNFTFVAADPDLDLIAEERPEAPVQDGSIIIDTPELQRGGKKFTAPEIEIRGRILSRGAPINVEVNGTAARLTDGGGFEAGLKLKAGVNRVTVFAITRENESLRYDFELFYEGDIQAVLGEGKRYAVLIANQDYAEGSGLTDLRTPVGDAEALAAILRDRYGFLTEAELPGGVRLNLFLTNASARDTGLTLDRLASLVGERDTVLVFYAGHGEYEEARGNAYWMPADAVAGAFSTYIEAKAINDALFRMKAANVLVISDSCYSGMLLRGGPQVEAPATDTERLVQLQRLAEKRSRVAMSSGGNEPVADGGGQGHSVFAEALIAALRAPEQPAFSARELFEAVHRAVILKAPQEPDFRPVTGAGHDGGDFVFVSVAG